MTTPLDGEPDPLRPDDLTAHIEATFVLRCTLCGFTFAKGEDGPTHIAGHFAECHKDVPSERYEVHAERIA